MMNEVFLILQLWNDLSSLYQVTREYAGVVSFALMIDTDQLTLVR